MLNVLDFSCFWLLILISTTNRFANKKCMGFEAMVKRFFAMIRTIPDKNGNFIWDGKTIHLKGLFNEVLAFQVIVETVLREQKELKCGRCII